MQLTADVLTDLRAATATAHHDLETSLNLLDPALDLPRYCQILCRFHGFWQTWQPRIATLIDDSGFTTPRDRRHLLIADLASLGLSHSAIAALPACPPPAMRTISEALGSLYVLEGSTLGGRQILKTVAPRLGLAATAGAAYFAGYGENTGAMWQSFLRRLAATPSPADAVQGAIVTFDALTLWLTKGR